MTMTRAPLAFLTLLSFLITGIIGPMPIYAQDYHLPAPGVMVHLSPPFDPPILKGIKVHPDNPFRFDFILDKGDGELNNDQLKNESRKLIKYFLASLTIPERDLWVNLSPYEKDRIIPQSFGLTEMGRDLLAEDYMLKQITASLIYPEDEIGKKFWKRIYEEAFQRYGTTNIPVNTFNKVWIVPEKAVVYENAKIGAAYVVESKLKVMLEQDYLSLVKHEGIQSNQTQITGTSQLGSQVVREIVIPELTKEINEDKNFVSLRQVYNSLILATWYKKKIKDSILDEIYADKNKVAGVQYTSTIIPLRAGIHFRNDVEGLYKEYLKAFKKGVYNYIKEEQDPITQEIIPRKYFSGGLQLIVPLNETTDEAMISPLDMIKGNLRLIAAQVNPFKKGEKKPESKFKRRAKKVIKVSAVVLVASVLGIYIWMRWGYDVSLRHSFSRPITEPEIVFQNGRITEFDGNTFQPSTVFSQQQRIQEALKTKTADRFFWQNLFAEYPQNQPVSAVVTPSLLRMLSVDDSNNLFNGLRTRPALTYRYLSEIPVEQMQEFSQHFSQLKPGIRQQIFAIFYEKLMDNFQDIESGKWLKTIIDKRAVVQSERMRQLYGEMTRALNVVQYSSNSRISQSVFLGPLITAPRVPVAPYEAVAFTRQQAIDGFYHAIFQTVDEYHKKGYAVTLPDKKQVNIGDVEGLISHYLSGDAGKQSYYVNNNAGLLLQWVQEMTSFQNPHAHRITQAELIHQAFKYAESSNLKEVDLFNVIASISHLFKSVARNPEGIVGSPWAMDGQVGTYYVWNHFQPSFLTYTLNSSGANKVDDQGRPVIFWRPVDAEGNDSIPKGQRTGIKIADLSHDFYHLWGVFLPSIYVRLKTYTELSHELTYDSLTDASKTWTVMDMFGKLRENKGNFHSTDMDYLPKALKIATFFGIQDFAYNHGKFSAQNNSEPEVVSDHVGAMAVEELNHSIVIDPRDHPQIITLSHVDADHNAPALKFIRGGLNMEHYVGILNSRWLSLRGQHSHNDNRERAELIATADQILNLESALGFHAHIEPSLRSYMASSAEANHLTTQEINDQLSVFEQLYGYESRFNFNILKAPYILDVFSYQTIPEGGEMKDSILYRMLSYGDFFPETYERLAKNPDFSSMLSRNPGIQPWLRWKLELGEDEHSVYFVLKYFSRLSNKWLEDHPGQEIPREAYQLMAQNGSLIEQAKYLDGGIFVDLHQVRPSGDIMLDVRDSIEALKRDMAHGRDHAMRGGIDFTAQRTPLTIQNGGIGIKFHIDSAQLAQWQNAPGLTIGSITIQPLKSLTQFLELNQNTALQTH